MRTGAHSPAFVRIGALATAVALAGCGSSAPKVTTFPYTSPDGRFSVVFPNKPATGVDDATDGVKRRVSSTMASKGSDEFGVTFSDFPASYLAAGSQPLLEQVRDKVIGDAKATIVSSEPMMFGKYPGLDVVANVASGPTKGEYHAKFVLAGTRIYEVLVIRNDPKASDERMTAFFDSFEITGS